MSSQLARLIRTGEAASLLGWSVAKVKQAALSGDLPYVQKLDGRTGAYLFDRDEIARIAAERAA